MSEEKIAEIALNANIIVAGFAYTLDEDNWVRVINLENTDEACVLDKDGNMIQTSMDDNVLVLAQAYYLKNKDFLEVSHA